MLRMYQQRHGIHKVRRILMGSSPTRHSLSLSSSKQPQHHAKESLITKRRRLLSVQTSTGKSSCNNNNVTMVGNQQLKHLRKISSTRTISRPMAEGNLQRVQHSSSSSSSSSSTSSTSVLDSVRTFSVANFWSPRTKQAAIMFLPIIGNVSYVAISSGFLMTDMLQLRLMLIGGYTGLVGFHSLHQKPLMIPLRWSAVFVALNALGAALLVMDRFAPTLNDVPGFEEDGEALYAQHFSSYLTRGQFHQLLALAERERVPPGTVLTRENLPSDSLYFIVKGKAHVYHGTLRRTPTNMVRRLPRTRSGHGHHGANDDEYGEEMEMTLTPTPTTNIATIEQGGFINDVAFQRGSDSGMDASNANSATVVGAYGTVITAGEDDCDVMVWDVATLRKHLKTKPDMERNIRFCLSDHLVKSLLRQREAAHKREREQQRQQGSQQELLQPTQ